MADNSKITKKQLNTAMTKVKKYADGLTLGGTGGSIKDGSITYNKLSDDAKLFTSKRINLINPNAYTGKHLDAADKTELIEIDPNKIYTSSVLIYGSGTWASYAYDKDKNKLGILDNYATITVAADKVTTKIEITDTSVKYLELYLYPSTTTAMLVEGTELPSSYVSYDTMSVIKNTEIINPLEEIIFKDMSIVEENLSADLKLKLDKLGFSDITFEQKDITVYDSNNSLLNNETASINLTNNSIVSPTSVKEYLYFTEDVSCIEYTPGSKNYYLLISFIEESNKHSGKMLEMTTTGIYALRSYDTLGTISSEIQKNLYTTSNTIEKIKITKMTDKITILINNTDKIELSYTDLECTKKNIRFGFSRVIGLPSYTIASNIKYSYIGKLQDDLLDAKDDMSNLKWNAIGDSMTYPEDAYHYWINKNEGITVNNYGVAGDTTGNISNRIDAFETNVDIVTVFAGTNDFGKDVPIATTKTNVESILTNLIKNNLGKKIAWILPIQRCDMEQNTLGLTLIEYVDAIKETCAKYSIPTLDLYREGNFPACISEFATKYMSTDNLHPNTAGQILLSKKILEFIKRI